MYLSDFNILNLIRRYKYLSGVLVLIFIIAISMLIVKFSYNQDVFLITSQEIRTLANDIRNHYKTRPDYWGLSTESAIKNNVIADTFLHNGKIVSSLGKEIIIGQDTQGNMVMPGVRTFMLNMPNTGKAACIDILTIPLEQQHNLGLIKIVLSNQNGVFEFEWGTKLQLPVNPETAKKYCLNHNVLSWVFE